MAAVKFEELNTKELAQGGFDKVIVPLGSCESHGDHLPFGMDAMMAYHLSMSLAERLDRVFVLPPMWFGMSLHYRHQPMCISMTNDTTIRVIRETLDSLAHWGLRKVILINGHDGNIPCLEVAARDAKLQHPELRIVALDAYWTTLEKLLPQDTFEVMQGMGHGGEAETSIGLAAIPHLVRMSEARGMLPVLDDKVKYFWDFTELTSNGATGDPTRATKAKGELMIAALVDYMTRVITDLEARDWLIETNPT
jgi:creatinine amidohydrolase